MASGLKRCGRCRVPLIFSRDHLWTSEGTICIPSDEKFRMVFVETRVMDEIMTELKNTVGDMVDNIVFESKRIHAKHYIDGLLTGAYGWLARSWVGSKKVYQEISKTGVVLGFGNISVDGYKRKNYVFGKLKEPYYLPFMAGDVAGVFESVEKTHCKGTYSLKDDGYSHIRIDATDKPGYLQGRLKFDETLIKGNFKHEPCPECKTPKPLSNYKWIEDRGVIERSGSERVVMMGMKDLNGVFLELENALGDPILEGIRKVNRDYGLLLREHKISMQKALDTMPVLGWGNPVRADIGKKKAEIRVENPFNADFIAPRLQTLFGGKKAEVKIKKEEGAIEMTITK